MSAEIIAIIGTNIVVVSVILTSMGRMESRLVGKIDSLALQLGKLCERMAHIDGLVSGLGSSIVAAARENQKLREPRSGS